MLVRCPRCSVSLDGEQKTSSGSASACTNCGYTGAPFGGSGVSLDPGPRAPMSTFAGARAKLATATQDLFRLSGGGPSIPVETALSEPAPPPPKPAEEPASSARSSEASVMFSLAELMKAAPAPAQNKREEPPDQLWSTGGAAPLFGTAYDQALLTTPLKPELTSMDAMTVPSRAPAVRRWLPIVMAIAGGSAALAGGAWWAFAPQETEVRPSEAVAAIAPAESPAHREATAPAPASPTPAPEAPSAAGAAAPEAPAPAETVAAAVAPAAGAEPPPGGAEPGDAKSLPDTSKTASKRPAPKAPSSAPRAAFNTNAARSALEAAAAKAAGCKGASGKGKVQLTFATSGRVSSAALVAGPFAGTPAASCVLRYFKAARVPAFSGAPQTVAKSFKIP